MTILSDVIWNPFVTRDFLLYFVNSTSVSFDSIVKRYMIDRCEDINDYYPGTPHAICYEVLTNLCKNGYLIITKKELTKVTPNKRPPLFKEINFYQITLKGMWLKHLYAHGALPRQEPSFIKKVINFLKRRLYLWT